MKRTRDIFLFLLCCLCANHALAESGLERKNSASLEGVWIEATRGCDLQLNEAEIRALATSGGNTYYAKTYFHLNKDTYSIKLFPGDGCDPRKRDPRRSAENMTIACREVAAKGVYKLTDGILVMKSTESSGHSYGRQIEQVKAEVIEGVLKISHPDLDCYRVKYFIPYPLS